jgi:hypothetical protein
MHGNFASTEHFGWPLLTVKDDKLFPIFERPRND